MQRGDPELTSDLSSFLFVCYICYLNEHSHISGLPWSPESRPPISMVFALEDGNKADFLLPCLYPYPLLSKADRLMSSDFNSTTFFLCLKLFSDSPKW